MRAPPPTHLLQVPASLPLERPAPTTQTKPAPRPASGLHCTQCNLAQLTIVGWQGFSVCGSNSSSNILNGGDGGRGGPVIHSPASGWFQSPHFPGTNVYSLSCSSNAGLSRKMVVWGPHPSLRGAPHTLAWEPQPRDKQYQLTFMGNYSSSAKALCKLLCPADLT